MTFLLIHGGGHSGRCWEPLLSRLDFAAVAIDLPGRGAHPAPLDEVRIADWVGATVEEVDAIDGDVVLVGHSMAGLTIPGVLAQAHERIRHVVFVSCAIPPDGASLLELLAPEFVELAESTPPSPEGHRLSAQEVRESQTYDMDEAQADFTVDIVVPEASWPVREKIDLAGLRQPVPRTWVRLLQDRSFPVDLQDTMAARAGCTDFVDLASGHMAMVSHPAELAEALNATHRGVAAR